MSQHSHDHVHASEHGHDHSHHHHDHEHGHGHGHAHIHLPAVGGERRLLAALVLTALFMVAEVGAGFLSGSLALLADAGHMLTDAVSLGLAWAAIRISRRPADRQRSYGYDRVQVLAAFVNGLTLMAMSVWIVVEAGTRLLHPVQIHATPMMTVAVLGLLVNIAAFAVLHGGAHDNLNMRGAVAHVLGDLLGSVAAIAAAGAILLWGWTQADPLLSALVALLILRSAWRLTRQSGHVLLEGVPEDFDADGLEAELPRAVAGVADVHHVHVWMLSPEKKMLTLHARIADAADPDRVTHDINVYLGRHHGISHVTVQIEKNTCAAPRH